MILFLGSSWWWCHSCFWSSTASTGSPLAVILSGSWWRPNLFRAQLLGLHIDFADPKETPTLLDKNQYPVQDFVSPFFIIKKNNFKKLNTTNLDPFFICWNIFAVSILRRNCMCKTLLCVVKTSAVALTPRNQNFPIVRGSFQNVLHYLFFLILQTQF